MAERGVNEVTISSTFSAKLVKWRVSVGQLVREGNVLAFYEKLGQSESAKAFITQPKLKSSVNGRVRKLLASEGDTIQAGKPVILIEQAGICEHKTIMKDLCCDCGADLRKLQGEQDEPSSPTSATVSMIHNIPELKVTQDEAEAVGKKDEERLLSCRKLALVVDLDQTLIHTTVDLVPADMKGVQHFCLPGHPVWYHTKFRPWAHKFLQKISKFYELHIFTMGSRMYAHTIARMLDPSQDLFSYRIRSRDDCFNAFSKSNDMKSLFPCGDSMVCIIDDRVDVWNNAPNLIKVKPYQFFKGVGDINAPSDKQVSATDVPEGESSGESNPAGEGAPPADKEVSTSGDDNEMTDDQEADTTAKDDPSEEVSDPPDEDMSPSADSNGKSVSQEGHGNDESNPTREGSLPEKPQQEILNNVIDKAKDGETGKVDVCLEIKDDEMEGDAENQTDSKLSEKEKDCEVEKSKLSEKEKDCEVEKSKSNMVNGSNNNVTPGKIPTPTEELEETAKPKGKQSETKSSNPGIDDERMECCTGDNCESIAKTAEEKPNIFEEDTEKETTEQVEPASEKGTGTSSENVQYARAHEDEDDYLLHLEEVLEKIHEKFYGAYDKINAKSAMSAEEAKKDPTIMRYCSSDGNTPCTKAILKAMRSEVLRGANIVFTGVIPTNIQPEKSDIWQRTLALGAKISNQVVTPKDAKSPSDVTTHVIAARLGTQKAYRAINTPGIKLVSPQWLWCCDDRWEWVDERLFHVEGVERYKKQIRTQSTPRGTPQDWVPTNEDKDNTGIVSTDGGDSFPEGSGDKPGPQGESRSRTCSSSSVDVLMASLHPLLSFSSMEMEAIDREVEELMHSDAEDSDVIGSISGSSSSSSSPSSSEDEAAKDENPTSRKRKSVDDADDVLTKKKKQDEKDSDESDDYTRRSSPSDDDDDDADDDDDGDDDMAALLEAELSHY